MESRPASSVTPAQLAQLFNSSFKGYIGGDVNLNADTFTEWYEQHLISMAHSHVFFDASISGDEPIAFCLIAEREDRPGHSRLGSMGVAGMAQGKRVGSKALATVVQRERERGVRVLELECIQSNVPALVMYQRMGFEIMRELPVWEREAVSVDSTEFADDPALEEVSVAEVDALVKKYAVADLPWQIWFVSKMSTAQRAFRLGHAWCATSDPEDGEKDMVKLATLLVEPEWRGRGEGTRLVRAMMGRFRGKKWIARGLFPREFGDGLARRVGAAELEVRQVQMRLEL